MIYVLFFIVLIIFLFSYFFTRKIFSPPCIICESYLLAIFLAILNVKKWNVNLSTITEAIIIVGILSFVIPYYVISIFYNTKHKPNSENKTKKIINVDQKLIIFFTFIQIITVLLFIYYTVKILNTDFNLAHIFSKMAQYRESKVHGEEIGMPFFIKQLLKISKAFLLVFSYIVINNIIESNYFKEKYKIPKLFILSIVLFIIQTLFSASRFDIAILILYLITLYYILSLKRNNKKLKLMSLKKLLVLFGIFLLIIYLFSATKGLFGRTNNNNAFDYASLYFGAPIKLLDMYVKNPIAKSDIWGKETFFAINSTLNSMGVIEYPYTIHLEWRSENGISFGNVYTSFRMYYQDFGWIGLVLLQIIYSVIISFLFLKCINKDSKHVIDNRIIVYSFIVFSLFLNSYRDFFYSQIVSVNYFNIIFYVYVISFILENIRFSLRKEEKI